MLNIDNMYILIWTAYELIHIVFLIVAKEPEYQTTILVIIFSDILMFDKIFVSPQVKRIVIISNKHGIYELPHELPNNLRLRTLGN